MNADPAYAEGGRRGLKKLEAEAAVEEGAGADSARLLGFARQLAHFEKADPAYAKGVRNALKR